MEPYIKEACTDIDEALNSDALYNDSIYEFILYLKFWMAKAEKIKEVVDGRSSSKQNSGL